MQQCSNAHAQTPESELLGTELRGSKYNKSRTPAAQTLRLVNVATLGVDVNKSMHTYVIYQLNPVSILYV
jgi:hypothetical protein